MYCIFLHEKSSLGLVFLSFYKYLENPYFQLNKSLVSWESFHLKSRYFYQSFGLGMNPCAFSIIRFYAYHNQVRKKSCSF